MKGSPPMPALHTTRKFLRAFTLVEVMVSTMIFALSATGLTSLYLQNLRYSRWQGNNVRVTNATFSMVDQIRNIGANQVFAAYVAADSGTPIPLNVMMVDPTDPNDGYKTIALNINQKNTSVVNSTWTTTSLQLGRLTTSGAIPVDYWITIRRNKSAFGVTPACDVLECTILYRWKVNSSAIKTLGQIQVSFPAPNLAFSTQFPN